MKFYVIFRRVFDIIDKNEARKLEVRGSDSNGDAVSNGDAGAVLVDDVSFAYPARPTHNALHGVTVSAAPRSVVALVGKSGCGKVNLTAYLYMCLCLIIYIFVPSPRCCP